MFKIQIIYLKDWQTFLLYILRISLEEQDENVEPKPTTLDPRHPRDSWNPPERFWDQKYCFVQGKYLRDLFWLLIYSFIRGILIYNQPCYVVTNAFLREKRKSGDNEIYHFSSIKYILGVKNSSRNRIWW